jgi:hypothetical protein
MLDGLHTPVSTTVARARFCVLRSSYNN